MSIPLRRKEVTLDHLRTLDVGPALAPSDIARIFVHSPSVDKVRDLCETGQLRAAKIYGRGRVRYRWLVPFDEVRRYFTEVGLLRAA